MTQDIRPGDRVSTIMERNMSVEVVRVRPDGKLDTRRKGQHCLAPKPLPRNCVVAVSRSEQKP